MTVPAMNPSENKALASVRSAFEILANGAPQVAEALLDVAVHGKSEIAKVQAGMAVLDRVGLPAKVDVGVTAVHLIGGMDSNGHILPAKDRVLARLRELRGQMMSNDGDAEIIQLFPGVGVSEGGDLVEGEVVEDEDE